MLDHAWVTRSQGCVGEGAGPQAECGTSPTRAASLLLGCTGGNAAIPAPVDCVSPGWPQRHALGRRRVPDAQGPLPSPRGGAPLVQRPL